MVSFSNERQISNLDGTLVHTTAGYRYAVVPRVLKQLGKTEDRINLKTIDKFWFDGERDKTIESELNCHPADFWKLFHKYDLVEERKKFTRVYDDVRPVLQKLKRAGKKLSITTGAPKRIAQIGNSSDDGVYAKAAGVEFVYLERREHIFRGTEKAIIHTLFELVEQSGY